MSANNAHVFLGQHHDHHAKRTTWVVILTLLMMVIEIAAGIAFGSMALLADGLHMATHAGALSLSAFAYYFAKKHAHNPSFSFGTGKIGDLAAFASALFLGLFAVGIAWEACMRLWSPQTIAFGQATLVAVVGLVVNVISAMLLHSDHDHDSNLKSAYLHVVADALTSLLAIAALLAGYYLQWVWLDAAVGLLGTFLIARWSWQLLQQSARPLLDMTPLALEHDLRARLETLGNTNIQDLHVWQVGPKAYAVIANVQTDCRYDVVYDALSSFPDIAHITLEHHPYEKD